jgi:hypothetical protein
MPQRYNQTWIQSVPPRGSGWVHAQLFWIAAYGVPTRYREVVLTVSNGVIQQETENTNA